MMRDLFSLLTLSGWFLLLFAAAELLYRFAKVRAEITRKIVHIGTGLLTLLFPVMLDEIWQAGLLCGGFFLILLLSATRGWLPSIHAIDRKSNGSLLYPAAVFGTFVFYFLKDGNDPGLFYVPILILALCDPLAALAGKTWARRRGGGEGKTIAGSLAFFLGAIVVIALVLLFPAMTCRTGENPLCHVQWRIPVGLGIALATTFAERLGGRGWDNLTIPAAAAGVYLIGYALV